ncbi:hypothetical protein COCNU_08G001500 [Cocos nucifera]|uniref:GDT1 family protein n=1 Tax=Cocos nucifera TaxID=13894 RepID=A0A8K0IGL3_COCNU|nr:hypothetical protein COCNU_08G001500 [Cocos nucifera]
MGWEGEAGRVGSFEAEGRDGRVVDDAGAEREKKRRGGLGDDDLKKQQRPFLTQFFSPIFLKAFSITFFGEWGDRSQGDDDLKKQQRPFLTQFFSPIFLKAFSITFFGEWGDRSQIATIGLAADEDPFRVVLGSIMAQALCATAAVPGGRSLASQISEKMVALSSGVLFLAFGLHTFLSVES